MNENFNPHENYPDSQEKIDIPTMKVIPLKKICMTIGELPTSYLETMTYYEMLVWFIEYLRNNIIPTINNNAQAIQEVQSVVLQLQNYINDFKDSIDEDVEELENYMNNYFDNLDVQEEINNKLDQMLEDGVLEQIIEQFIQSTAVWCFDTISDLKNATNLTNGSFAKTLGYYSINDGGSAIYKISTTEPLNYYETLNNGNYAELVIDNEVSPEQFGAYGDGTHDDTTKLQYAINYGYSKNVNIKGNKNYYISSTINMIEKDKINLYLNKIIIDSDISAINLENTKYANIIINEIINNNENRVGIAFNFSQNEGVYPDTLVQGNNIVLHWIKNFNKGIYLIVTEDTRTNGIQYNHFEFDYIEDCNYCIAFKNHNYHQWINNNYFKGGRMSGLNGIYCEGSQGDACDVQANVFEGIGFEEFNNIAINLINADYNHFIDMRVAEKGENLQYWVQTASDCSYNLFHSHSNMDRNYINDLTDGENIYDSKMYDSFGSVGFGRIYCHNNKFFTDDDYYNYTFSTIWKDFNAYNNDNFTFNNEEVFRNKFLITLGGDSGGVNKSIVHLNDMFATGVNNRHVIKEFYIRCSSFDSDTIMEIRDADNNVIIDKNSINFQVGHFYKVEKIIQQRPWQIHEI